MPSPLWSLALLPIAAVTPAQEPVRQGAGPTVESYLCTFAGKCDGANAAPTETRDAPATRGFRLARPTAEAPVAVMPSRARARARAAGVVRSTRTAPSYGRTAPRAAVAASAPAPTVGSVQPGRRANLMIGFELNSDKLTAEGAYAAQMFARALQSPELQGRRFLIEGHTDLRGGRAINTALSARRAQAVADYLVVLGVDRGRLNARGFGSSAPLPGRKVTDPANRRVEAELIS